MRHKTTQTLFNYFNLVRKGERAPLRSEIDPSALKTALPDLFILGPGCDDNMIVRLAGMRVCAILGHELRGLDFNLFWLKPNRHKMRLAVQTVLASKQPLLIETRLTDEHAESHVLEMLLLPLCSEPGVCDRILGCLVDIDHQHHREGAARLLGFAQMQFLATEDAPSDPDLVDVPPLAPSLHVAALRNKVLQLRVLEGGREI